jgi:hypothetical protein
MNTKDITVVIPTSILPSHPRTDIIDQTIKDVRAQLPDSEIILQIDGLRDEQVHRKAEYDEYKNRVLWKCMHEWSNVVPIVFEEHLHQSGMMNRSIDLITTPLMLYVEGDAPLTPDRFIDWEECIDFIESDKGKVIRFHFEAVIPEPHEHLIFAKVGNFLQTIQWSQRPHLTTVDFYREQILPNCPDKTFIEDTIHGYIQDVFHMINKKVFWKKIGLYIYHPDGDIKRSYHLDGRDGTRKFTSDDDAWGYRE